MGWRSNFNREFFHCSDIQLYRFIVIISMQSFQPQNLSTIPKVFDDSHFGSLSFFFVGNPANWKITQNHHSIHKTILSTIPMNIQMLIKSIQSSNMFSIIWWKIETISLFPLFRTFRCKFIYDKSNWTHLSSNPWLLSFWNCIPQNRFWPSFEQRIQVFCTRWKCWSFIFTAKLFHAFYCMWNGSQWISTHFMSLFFLIY